MELSSPLARAVLGAIQPRLGDLEPVRVSQSDAQSNELIFVHFPGKRVLIIKEARHYLEDAARRFASARRAARDLRSRAQVLAPEYFDLPDDLWERPLAVYWKVQQPVLEELYPALPAQSQPRMLRSLGRLVSRLHTVRYPGYGSLTALNGGGPSFREWLEADLGERLLPPVRHSWAIGAPRVERLLGAVRPLSARVDPDGGVLTHNDLHMGNVLCENGNGEARCAGVIDLENVASHPPESDLAKLSVYHGPLLGRPLLSPWRWWERIWEGYGSALDPLLLAFFRGYHLINLAFHAAITGNTAHAGTIALTADVELEALAPP